MLKQLKRELLPAREIAQVNAENADGTVTATTRSGKTFRATGSGNVGSYVYIQDGRVLGPAPDLPHSQILV
ncbi:hypothetical protein [Shewanella algae]|jgi:hypothetical protein|uniref:hypothetical protein n=1 Tax=Shewanella TaxID=22 RepID=UPI0030048153